MHWEASVQRFLLWLRTLAYPIYDCERCVGQGPEHGCFCAYHDTYGPCYPSGRWYNRLARWAWHLRFPKADGQGSGP